MGKKGKGKKKKRKKKVKKKKKRQEIEKICTISKGVKKDRTKQVTIYSSRTISSRDKSKY